MDTKKIESNIKMSEEKRQYLEERKRYFREVTKNMRCVECSDWRPSPFPNEAGERYTTYETVHCTPYSKRSFIEYENGEWSNAPSY